MHLFSRLENEQNIQRNIVTLIFKHTLRKFDYNK
jgi:hypothetical protein